MTNYSPRLNIVLFNTHTSDTGTRITADYRHESMDEILDSIITENYPNLFILAQDKIGKRTEHKMLCEKLHQDHTLVPHKEEAGLYYDTETNTHYDVEYLDVATLQQTDDALGYEAGSVFTVSRLTACVLTPKADVTTGKKILLVSWHGPNKVNRKEEPNRQDPERARRRCFARLVCFLDRLKVRKGCDMVIVGGDFNLPAGTACEELGPIDVNGKVSARYTPTDDRPDRAPIDYVVYWPRDGLQDAEVSVVRPDFRREIGNRPFDHCIVLYKLEEIETFSDVARQLSKITVYSLEKIESFSDWARRLRKMFMYNSDKLESYSDWVRQLRRITVYS